MNTNPIISRLRLGLPALLAAGFLLPVYARAASPAPRATLVADLDVNLVLEAPPPPRHEVIVERTRPSRDHVWIAGYWGWSHGRREWVSGHWEMPPRGRTVWVEPRWEHRDRGYVFVEGRWEEPRHDRDHDHDRDRH